MNTKKKKLVAKKDGILKNAAEAPAEQKPYQEDGLPPGFVWTPPLRQAFTLMDETDACLFITGKAGTGKSTLLQYFRRKTSKKVAVVAPTGAAAVNVAGQTLHSFFRFPPRPLTADDIHKVRDRRLYKALDALVVDEVSMVRADLMDAIDAFLRLNGPDKNRPFGGVQMILIGDPFQLPPVVSRGAEAQYLKAQYKTPYFFSARALRASGLETIELEEVFRQKDQDLIALLNAIRTKTVTQDELEHLNLRCRPDFTPPADTPYVTLTTTNARADHINTEQLAALSTKERSYDGLLSGEFALARENALPAPARLRLKEGAQVMFVRNDPLGRWVNGTMGRVCKLGIRGIEVEVADDVLPGSVTVEPTAWEMLKYQFDAANQRITTEVAGTFTQFPLALAYAVTIHKGQGKSFDRIIVDLTGGAFAYGQVYVALSRCRTLEGLVLRTPLRLRDIRVDETVVTFNRYRHLLKR